MIPPAATLSAICTCARAPVPPIPRTATYRPVQARKTAGRSTCGAGFPPPRTTPRALPGRTPHARHAQALDQDSKPVHLPSTPDAPSMYFSQARATGQRREPCLAADMTRPSGQPGSSAHALFLGGSARSDRLDSALPCLPRPGFLAGPAGRGYRRRGRRRHQQPPA